jgi:hypothetical protein
MKKLDTLQWKPPSNSSREQNKLLEEYCRAFGGTTFAEVPVGRGIYPRARRLDGVRFPASGRRELASYDGEKFNMLLSDAQRNGLEVEVIEVTRRMEQRGEFGQVILGVWLLKNSLLRTNGGKARVKRVVVSGTKCPPLERFLAKHSIRVWWPD